MKTNHPILRGIGRGAAATALVYWGISFIAAYRLSKPKRRYAAGVSPALYHLESSDVFFPARGGDARISGWYIPCKDSHKAVVLVHGKDSSRAAEIYGRFLELAQSLHQRGLSVLMIDLRGHGYSGPGLFSFGINERRDVMGAVDWLKSKGYPAGGIGVLGISLGSSAILGAAAEDPEIGAVVSDSGFADIAPVIKENFQTESRLPSILLPGVVWAGRALFGYDFTASHPVEDIERIRVPVLLIHGTDDRLIPLDHARKLQAAGQNTQLWVVSGAIHAGCYGINPPEYADRVGKFFEENLS